MLDIIYQDEHLVAINKPHGLLVHRSPIAADADEFAVQVLRDQIDQRVYPVHRLDRKTAGVLLFALNKEADRAMQMMFMNNQVTKHYYAVVRGFTPDAENIDYPLKKDNGTLQDAFTSYQTIARTEIDIPLGQHRTSRYSFIEAQPLTGRMHQLRKHFSHVFHPIIGDRTHGCNKQNKLFKELWDLDSMLLHAHRLAFLHPYTKEEIVINASIRQEFFRMLALLNLSPDI